MNAIDRSPSAPKIRVLVVDDSPMSQLMMRHGLVPQEGFEVVGTATCAHEAKTLIVALRPDVVTLDLELPGMHGFLLEKLMQFVIPTVVISALVVSDPEVVVRATVLGAVAVVSKVGPGESPHRMVRALREAVRAAALCGRRPASNSRTGGVGGGPWSRGEFVIAIGASTGGPRTLGAVLEALDADAPPVLVVQHMPRGFIESMAEHLDRVLRVRVREAADGDRLEPGLVLIAPAGAHMTMSGGSSGMVTLCGGPRVHQQRPSVDVLFASVATSAGAQAVGVQLTGMGTDGAEGLERMRRAGAWTMAQDEQTSVVFGMPKAAIERGAAMQVAGATPIGRALAAWARMRRTVPSPNLMRTSQA